MKKRMKMLVLLLSVILLFGCGSNKTVPTPQNERESELQESGDIQDEEDDGLTQEDLMFGNGMTFDLKVMKKHLDASDSFRFDTWDGRDQRRLIFGVLSPDMAGFVYPLESGFECMVHETTFDQEDVDSYNRWDCESHAQVVQENGQSKEKGFRTYRENGEYYFFYDFYILPEEKMHMKIRPKSLKPNGKCYETYFDFVPSEYTSESFYNDTMNELKIFYGDFETPTLEEIISGGF